MTGRTSEPSPPAAALKRLREQVEHAARALQQLYHENERLRAQVKELEAHSSLVDDGTLVALNEDPEALRLKIETYIDAIDHALAETRE